MRKFILLAVAMLIAAGIYAQNVIPGGDETITFKGFVSATAFLQNQTFGFGNGQNAEWATGPQLTTNNWFYGMDIRNTRLTFGFNSKKEIKGWKFDGVIEADFFGGFNGNSLFSAQQLIPRLRLAYMDFVHKNIRIRLGQAWTPMFGNVPVSLSHIAFPLGYGNAGMVGWRFPGVYFYWGLNGKDHPVKVQLDAALFTGAWNKPGNNVNFLTGGNLGSPQMELKLNLMGKTWKIYAVVHYDKKNLAPVNVNAPDSTLNGTAFEIGAKYHPGGFLLQGNFFTGENIGQQFGEMTQFSPSTHDISSTGGWAQIGYKFPSKYGLYAYYGTEKVNKDKALAAGLSSPRTSNNLLDFMVDKSVGSVTIGLEYLYSNLTYGASDTSVHGSQFAFSVLYKF